MTRFAFTIAATDGRARAGTIAMRRGEIRTPAFMPVGTAATVKAMKPADVRATGADIILGNTYHLMLRPGAERIARLGGLHQFMGWERPILTDSGGYQVMSISELAKVSEEGVAFPAISTAAGTCSRPNARGGQACSARISPWLRPIGETTIRPRRSARRWSARCAGRGARAGLFRRGRRSASTGRPREEMRRASADALVDIGFEAMRRRPRGREASSDARLPRFRARPIAQESRATDGRRQAGRHSRRGRARNRHVRLRAAHASGRNGGVTWDGPLNIRNAKFAEDPAPLDPESPVAQWSKAYLHHLVRSGEILGAMLMTEHNLWFYQRLLQELREAIVEGRLAAFANGFRARYGRGAARE